MFKNIRFFCMFFLVVAFAADTSVVVEDLSADTFTYRSVRDVELELIMTMLDDEKPRQEKEQQTRKIIEAFFKNPRCIKILEGEAQKSLRLPWAGFNVYHKPCSYMTGNVLSLIWNNDTQKEEMNWKPEDLEKAVEHVQQSLERQIPDGITFKTLRLRKQIEDSGKTFIVVNDDNKDTEYKNNIEFLSGLLSFSDHILQFFSDEVLKLEADKWEGTTWLAGIFPRDALSLLTNVRSKIHEMQDPEKKQYVQDMLFIALKEVDWVFRHSGSQDRNSLNFDNFMKAVAKYKDIYEYLQKDSTILTEYFWEHFPSCPACYEKDRACQQCKIERIKYQKSRWSSLDTLSREDALSGELKMSPGQVIFDRYYTMLLSCKATKPQETPSQTLSFDNAQVLKEYVTTKCETRELMDSLHDYTQLMIIIWQYKYLLLNEQEVDLLLQQVVTACYKDQKVYSELKKKNPYDKDVSFWYAPANMSMLKPIALSLWGYIFPGGAEHVHEFKRFIPDGIGQAHNVQEKEKPSEEVLQTFGRYEGDWDALSERYQDEAIRHMINKFKQRMPQAITPEILYHKRSIYDYVSSEAECQQPDNSDFQKNKEEEIKKARPWKLWATLFCGGLVAVRYTGIDVKAVNWILPHIEKRSPTLAEYIVKSAGKGSTLYNNVLTGAGTKVAEYIPSRFSSYLSSSYENFTCGVSGTLSVVKGKFF